MNHVILADPVPEIGRQEKWGIVIKVDEASCHGGIFTIQGQGPSSKSDRLLAVLFQDTFVEFEPAKLAVDECFAHVD